MKMLIAVKSEVIAGYLASSLSRYDIHTCNTGVDALAILETLQPEILLLDLSLPAIDGLTLLRRIRYKPMYILAFTNLLTPSVLMDAAAVGIQDVLLIPCTIHHILEHLDDLTEKAPSAES